MTNTSNSSEMLNTVLHEFAILIDLFFEDEEIGGLAEKDSTFVAFQRARQELEERNIRVSSTVQHVQRRIERARGVAFQRQLPAPGDNE